MIFCEEEARPARQVPAWMAAICVVVVLGVYLLYFEVISPRTFDPATADLAELQQLLLWGSANLVLTTAMLWCAGLGLLVLRQFWKDFTEWEQRIFLGLAIFASVLITVLVLRKPEAGFGGGKASEVVLAVLFTQRPSVKWLVAATNVLGTLVMLSLIGASVIVTRGAAEADARALGTRLRWFRVLLYSAGVCLGLIIYEVFRLYDWGSTLASAGGVSYQGLASSLTFATGAIFSSIMAVVFLPSAIQLDEVKARLLSRAAAADPASFKPEMWELIHRIPASPLKALGSYVAVLLPLVTGILTKLLESWVGLGGAR